MTRRSSFLVGGLLVLALILSFAALPTRAVSAAPTGIADVPEAAEYSLIYEFAIPRATSSLNNTIAYAVDNSNAFTQPFDRVAYYLELQSDAGTRWLWVSMDAFTANVKKIGVPGAPAAIVWNRPVHRLNVYTNVAGVTAGSGIETGVIEFWPSSYNATNDMFMPNASDTVYDWGDGGASFGAGYGAMQVSNLDADGDGPGTVGQTLFAYNAWGQAGFADDLGIGNAPSGNPDWTFAGGSRDYTARTLRVYVRPSPVRFTALPQDRQLYGQDKATHQASVPISGEVIAEGYDQAIARVYRHSSLVATVAQPLSYSGGVAPFSFAPAITAELANYDVELSLSAGGVERSVHRSYDLVAGDVYVIQGQSNAVAAQISGDANGNASPFVRTYGTSAVDTNGVPTVSDSTWYIANGNTANVGGAIGQWGLRFGRRLVDATGIPVAIMNGAHGGQPITFFQRNDANPLDLSTNYGRLLHRMQAASIAGKMRGILWHQGESDVDNAAGHESGWTALHADWLVDYPSTEQTYNHQVRDGCGPPSIELRDVQRRFQDNIPDVTAMSTTGIDGHDGCHYYYENGYKLIGDHIADLVLRDFYAQPDLGNVLPPNPQAAYWGNTGHAQIVIPMRNTADGLTWDAGAEADIKLEGASVTASGATTSGNTLRITLSGDGSAATGITYDGHAGAGPWIKNLRGLGLLDFYNLPITVAPAAEGPAVTISPQSGEAALGWSPSYANCSYEVHRSSSPYFTPAGATLLAPALTAGSAGYTDPASSLGDLGLNQFYVVKAGNCDGGSAANSNRVGEFDFGLQ